METVIFDKETETYLKEIEEPKLVIINYSIQTNVMIEFNNEKYNPFDKELVKIIGKEHAIHQEAVKYQQIITKALNKENGVD